MANKNTIVDLRSDTLTKPTPAMLEAMMAADVGDDVFGEDSTVNSLESKVATMFGKEAAMFCPSGTMSNQIAIRVLTQPQDEVICDRSSHIYLYEGGGMAYNSMVSVALIDGERGRLQAHQVEASVRPYDVLFPQSKVVVLENTSNKGGGSYYELDQIAAIHRVCQRYGLSMHLDGARVFNALTETGHAPVDIGHFFDTISICLSKGLGAPVGSLLLGSEENIKKARRVRKVLGGGMRQSGYMAAAGLYALDHHIGRLKDDHDKARRIGQMLGACTMVERVEPVDTNIVIGTVRGDVQDFLGQLRSQGILALAFGGHSVRMVTHLGVSEEMMNMIEDGLRAVRA
ncbi:MAG: aminotransferase class I/II-fold pyridoxal phosphate-dependent enzyme [Cyclobacteriaceae bacterium]|nr:aminotransferase class I/II-fold pyridoxal phosphate-dependent enzyme [Cyclobacteriaceae bacterium]